MMDQKENFVLRKARPEDAAKIASLVNSAYRGDSSRVGWTTEAGFLEGQRTDSEAIADLILTPNHWILLAEDQGKLFASAEVEKKDDRTCYFGMFAVQPVLQAKGIGKKFLIAAEEFARQELGCQWMEMTVITIRQELIAWYERRGYQSTGEVRPFFYGNERFGIPLRDDLKLGVWRKRL